MHNLISIRQLDEERHNVTFTSGAWKVMKGVMVIAPENKTGTLYMTSSCRDMVFVINSNANSDLWHFRLKHISEKGMKVLISNHKFPRLKFIEHKLYGSYIFRKQKRVSFSKIGQELKEEKLELVHIEVWAPLTIASSRGSNYYVTFIDDSTMKIWVYFLKNKFDIFDTFKKWKVMFENETNLKVKCLSLIMGEIH